jgi:peptidoglycan/xylan/chitin deacetylase (PgdA/CDA1 family)
MVVNYHRIGNPAETIGDPGVFSATAEEFDLQIGYLKRRFHLTTLDDALAMISGEAPWTTSALITFDDGYLDNYKIVFPILRSHGVQGVFFLPTGFVGTGQLPWWDMIAHIIKKSRNRYVRLEYPEPATFDLETDGLANTCRDILQLAKKPEMKDAERFVTDLEEACGATRLQENTERLFLNWDEAREMQLGGMAFGSHTHSHEILSKLSPDKQLEEAVRSREILERELGRRIDVMAYCFWQLGLAHFGGLIWPTPWDVKV